MAANVSPEYIQKKLVALVKHYNNLDEKLVKLVAHQYAFDFKKAQKTLAEIEGQRVNSAKIPKINQGNNHVPGNYVGPSDLYDSIVHIIKEGHKVLVLMRGLPGSGKTTLAMQILYRSLGTVNKEKFILSPDEYVFSPGSNIYNINKIDEPHQWNQKRCFTNMRKGVSPIIIDDVNLEIEDMKVYCVMAVQFGYVIRIAVPLTSWAFNSRMLTIKNNHGVNEMKIKEMYKRFQQNITAKDLHDKFKLQYSELMPQLRKYPPLQRTLQPMEQIGVAAGKSTGQEPPQREYSERMPQLGEYPPLQRTLQPMEQIGVAAGKSTGQQPPQREYGSLAKEKPQLPIEYVHKFEVRREIAPPKKQTPDVGKLIDIENETKSKRPSIDDLLRLSNEDEPILKNEDPVKSIGVDVLAKQLQENNELMVQVMAFLQQSVIKDQGSTSDKKLATAVTKMEVDQSVDLENQLKIKNEPHKTDGRQVSSSSSNIDTLQKQTMTIDQPVGFENQMDIKKQSHRQVSSSSPNIDSLQMQNDLIKEMLSKIRNAESSKEEKLEVSVADRDSTDSEAKKENTSDPIAKMISETENFQFEGFSSLPAKPEANQPESGENRTFAESDLINQDDDTEMNSILDTLDVLKKRNKELRKMVTKIQDSNLEIKKSEMGSLGLFADSKIKNVATPFELERFQTYNLDDTSYRNRAVNQPGSSGNRTLSQNESNNTDPNQIQVSTVYLQALLTENEELWDMLSKM